MENRISNLSNNEEMSNNENNATYQTKTNNYAAAWYQLANLNIY
jgi:hypothetical protein